MASDKSFTFLAFSDLRVGSAEWGLIPGPSADFVEKLVDDIVFVHRYLPTFDAVIFVGNLVESGQVEQFVACSALLYAFFLRLSERMEWSPVMLCVPGDHDLDRAPSGTEAPPFHWNHDTTVVNEMALRSVKPAFKAYESWAREWTDPNARLGTVPGDFYLRLPQVGKGVGIIGLNTALGQVSDESPAWVLLKGSRLSALIDGSSRKWSEDRLHLLIGHHPPSWFLSDGGDQALYRDPKVFQLHLCGHAGPDWPWPEGSTVSPTVVQCPSLCPSKASPVGYLAGTVNLEDPSSLSLYQRRFEPELSQWRSAHHLSPRFSISLPHGQRAPAAIERLRPTVAASEPIYVESLKLTGFRSFDSLNLKFRRRSRLSGEWTCIAGINGAGKSGILQALSLVLLGDPWVRELGGERLNRMRRLVNDERQCAVIEAELTMGARERRVDVRLEIDEAEEVRSVCDPDDFWQQLRASRVVAAYGASRNLSSRTDSGYENLSADVRRMISMFDPLSQLASAEVLIRESAATEIVARLFQTMVAEVFGTELRVEMDQGKVRFVVTGCDRVEAIDLPDGFRASAAWMADLCAIWAAKAPDLAQNGNPADIQAIVMLDEIDLHLHPALQRSLVPRLRTAMPKVQWIVTTHSPLVLGNFDSSEVIALDRAQAGNVRVLDRQILGFSADQIYEWLMGTEPTGEAIEEEIERSDAQGLPDDIAQLLTVSPKIGEAEAKERIGKLKNAIERIRK